MQTFSAVQMAQYILLTILKKADNVVDATAGNGNDSLFLASNTPLTASVWAFDIQDKALANTRNLLQQHGLLEKVKLIKACHSTVADYISREIDAAMFNLGYLPGESHKTTTMLESTINALKECIGLLKVGGVITIIAYPGHATGKLEHAGVRAFLFNLPSSIYAVGSWSSVNHRNEPPILYIIEKMRSEAREGTASRKN